MGAAEAIENLVVRELRSEFSQAPAALGQLYNGLLHVVTFVPRKHPVHAHKEHITADAGGELRWAAWPRKRAVRIFSKHWEYTKELG